jgi:tetratricopeptide (TPR) repeat protein
MCLLDLENLMAALEYWSSTQNFDQVISMGNHLVALLSSLNRPKALKRVVTLRNSAVQQTNGWSNARFEKEISEVERLLDTGRVTDAIIAVTGLFTEMEKAGPAAYDGAAFDIAVAEFILGRCLKENGAAEEALTHLKNARQRFLHLDNTSMAHKALTDAADALRLLGRLEEAASDYELSIVFHESSRDHRQVAVNKNQLGHVRLLQRRYRDALALYKDSLGIFKALHEPANVAGIWHQIASVYAHAGQPDKAEEAFQEALKGWHETDDPVGEAKTLSELGGLYSSSGQADDAVRCLEQAAARLAQARVLWYEGLIRGNLADVLCKCGRYDEALVQAQRSIQLKRPFGHSAEPWLSFGVLSRIEASLGNEVAALEARKQAINSYAAYRRDGGDPKSGLGMILERDPKGLLNELRAAAELPPNLRALIEPLEAIMSGRREESLLGNPDLEYIDVAELKFFMETFGQ